MSAPRYVVPAFLGVVLSMPSAAYAQYGLIHHTLHWVEVYYGATTPVSNPNGIIEPGEGAMLRMSVSFTEVGTPVTYGVPPSGVAPVAGYAATVFRVLAAAAEGGDWSHTAGPPGFGITPPLTLPDGSIHFTGTAQTWVFGGTWMPDPANPYPHVWRSVWTPSMYSHRTVEFSLADYQPITHPIPTPPQLYVFLGTDPTTGHTLFAFANAGRTWDSVQIPVVPAPGALMAFTAACLAAMRRDRRWMVRGRPRKGRSRDASPGSALARGCE